MDDNFRRHSNVHRDVNNSWEKAVFNLMIVEPLRTKFGLVVNINYCSTATNGCIGVTATGRHADKLTKTVSDILIALAIVGASYLLIKGISQIGWSKEKGGQLLPPFSLYNLPTRSLSQIGWSMVVNLPPLLVPCNLGGDYSFNQWMNSKKCLFLACFRTH